VCALVAYGWALYALLSGGGQRHFIGGLVLAGLAGVCASLIALVTTIDRQIRNVFDEGERFIWTYWVIGFGALNLVLGLATLLFSDRPYRIAPGFVLIGLTHAYLTAKDDEHRVAFVAVPADLLVVPPLDELSEFGDLMD